MVVDKKFLLTGFDGPAEQPSMFWKSEFAYRGAITAVNRSRNCKQSI